MTATRAKLWTLRSCIGFTRALYLDGHLAASRTTTFQEALTTLSALPDDDAVYWGGDPLQQSHLLL